MLILALYPNLFNVSLLRKQKNCAIIIGVRFLVDIGNVFD